MIGDDIEIFFSENEGAFRADEDLVEGFIKTVLGDRILVTASCQQRRFVDQVCQVRANHTRSGTSNGDQVNVFGQGHITAVDFENSQAAIPVWPFDGNATIKTTGTQQRLIQSIRAVGGADYD